MYRVLQINICLNVFRGCHLFALLVHRFHYRGSLYYRSCCFRYLCVSLALRETLFLIRGSGSHRKTFFFAFARRRRTVMEEGVGTAMYLISNMSASRNAYCTSLWRCVFFSGAKLLRVKLVCWAGQFVIVLLRLAQRAAPHTCNSKNQFITYMYSFGPLNLRFVRADLK